MLHMVRTGILPACLKDLALYKDAAFLIGKRSELYSSITTETQKLSELADNIPHEMVAEAEYLCDTIKPQMAVVRALVDEAEGLIQAALYPYPTYEAMLYHHHH